MISNLYYKANAAYGGLFGVTVGASIAKVGLLDVYIDAQRAVIAQAGC